MLFVKLLCLFAGGGVLTGVSVSNAYKGNPQTPVANNKTAKKLAKMELKLTNDILKIKQKLKVATKTSSDAKLKVKTNELEAAKTASIKANNDLNTTKKKLNKTSQDLKEKYTDLENKNKELEEALKAKMQWELDQNDKALKKAFYDAQKTAYETEKESIEAKIKAIEEPKTSTATDICGTNKGATWTLNVTDPNDETNKIQTAIKTELAAVCEGLETSKAQSEANKADLSKDKSEAYDAAKKARDEEVTKINKLTQEYNQQIHTIRYAESTANTKKMHWTQKQSAHKVAKEKSERVKNELDLVNEKIDHNNGSLSSF